MGDLFRYLRRSTHGTESKTEQVTDEWVANLNEHLWNLPFDPECKNQGIHSGIQRQQRKKETFNKHICVDKSLLKKSFLSLNKHLNNTEWYKKHCCLLIQEEQNQQQKLRIRYEKFCSLRMTFNTVKLLICCKTQVSVEHLLEDCLIREENWRKKDSLKVNGNNTASANSAVLYLWQKVPPFSHSAPSWRFQLLINRLMQTSVSLQEGSLRNSHRKISCTCKQQLSKRKLTVHYNPNSRGNDYSSSWQSSTVLLRNMRKTEQSDTSYVCK